MKKFYLLTKTLLVAVLLMVGANAWGDGNKRVLDSNDYTAGATDWTCPNATSVYKNTGTSPRKYYAQCYESSGSGNRSCYKSVSYSSTVGTGYTTADLSTVGYNIEFDFLMRSGAAHNRAQSQFVVPTTGPNIATNNAYSGTDYIFSLSQPTRYKDAETGNGDDIGYDTKWYINDLSNVTDKTVTLDISKWYHLKLVVTATSVDYTISEYAEDGSSEMSVITNGTGSLAVASLPTIKGFWALLGRKAGSNNGLLNFTNFEMYDYSILPQMTKTRSLNFKEIAGSVLNKASDSSCTLTFDEKGADNHYAITTEGFNSNFAVSTNRTDKGWNLRYYGSAKEANTGLWLYALDGTMSVRNLQRGAWVTFNASAAVTASSNAVSSTDVASASGCTYAFQVSNAGYATFNATKNSYVYSMDVYEPVNEVIGLLDKSTTYMGQFKSMTIKKGETMTINFKNRGKNDQFYHNWAIRFFNSEIDRAFTADNRINGGDAGFTYGIDMDGTTMNWDDFKDQMQDAEVEMTVAYATDGTFSISASSTCSEHTYNHTMSYGTALSEDLTLELGVDNSWMEVMSVDRNVSATIGEYGYATFCSEYPLDFTSVSNATAWVATACNGSKVTMTQVEGSIYQGKGLVLKSNSGAAAEVTIPVVASSTNYYDDNMLVACLEETTVTPSGDGTNYVLSVQGDEVVFAPVTSAEEEDNPTVGAGHAYLYVPSGGGARAISMVFGDEILTGINEAAAATEAAQKEGKFIIDGKLVIFKKGMKFNANGQRIY